MSIAIQNRSPLPRTSCLEPTSSLPQSTPTPRAGNDLQRKLQTDSFEQGDLTKLQAQLSQLLGGLTQQLQSLGVQAPASLGGEAPPAPASISAQKPSAPSLAAKTAEAPRTNHTSDAGPGFGAPSAGSTVPAPVDQPWLAKNNVGSPYNSNIQLIDPGQKDQFKYTNTFTNSTNQPQTITLWNKTGEHGGPNDGQHFDKSTPKTFTLQPGQSQLVAFDTNTSVAWCVSKDGTANPSANYGQTWGEASFGHAATGWSGYDTSQISPAGHQGKMSISNQATGAKVTEANAWQTPSDSPVGRDVGVPAGPLHLSTVFS
ncbi:hypothetical protein [Myxococcus fulvus]|uniref:hypothetical protein n=1 Tax=Myxococcus TaxID=32 RepID=UPI0020BFD981|nr:hypothetical protein [Myxococcus fulvus]MCK8497881.1 hypothetical protein [Myxococcus fulvus]